jgi:hypothetical protein
MRARLASVFRHLEVALSPRRHREINGCQADQPPSDNPLFGADQVEKALALHAECGAHVGDVRLAVGARKLLLVTTGALWTIARATTKGPPMC